jgi:hypothetical protein
VNIKLQALKFGTGQGPKHHSANVVRLHHQTKGEGKLNNELYFKPVIYKIQNS